MPLFSFYRTKRLPIYSGAFFFTLATGITGYTISSFVEALGGRDQVGLFFALASATTIAALFILPSYLEGKRYRRVIGAFLAISFAAALIVSLPTLSLSLPLFALACLFVFRVATTILPYLFDLYLEEYTDDEKAGRIRGFFLFISNGAWLIGVLLVGLILGDGTDYPFGYLASALVLLPALFTCAYYFGEKKRLTIGAIRLFSFRDVLRHTLSPRTEADRNLHNLLFIDFILNFFYAIMVVYTPLYLHDVIGLSWLNLGVIFTVMLLPFVLIEYPLGLLADRWCGEKEIIAGGLLIIALATAAFAFTTTTSVAAWAVILFVSRIGAAALEIGKETYLFKKVGAGDSGLISLFRMMAPLSYLVAPLAASLFLSFFSFNYLFAATAGIVLLGLAYVFPLHDTR